MQSKFAVEVWRIIKYILISLAVNLLITRLCYPLLNAVVASAQVGRALTLFSYGQLALNTTIVCLLHRYFTFRASESWFIALPLMLLFALGWMLVSSICLQAFGRASAKAVVTGSYLLNLLKLLFAYLFQRYVIYCHSTDENGWYRRFHPTTDEEGAYPYE